MWDILIWTFYCLQCFNRRSNPKGKRTQCFRQYSHSPQRSLSAVWQWSVSLATTSAMDRRLPEHAPHTAVGRRVVAGDSSSVTHDNRQSQAIAALPTNDSVLSNNDDESAGSRSTTEQRSSADRRLSSRWTCRRKRACRKTPAGKWKSRLPARSSFASWDRPANVPAHTCVSRLSDRRRSRSARRAEKTSSGRKPMTFWDRDRLSSFGTESNASV